MPTLNLGIVAHVDAGKTTLTERLLFEAGVISAVGRVDAGSTITDSDALERRRGITIRSGVVAFRIGDLKVNLIDTPGHSDFVAEVERALAILDGAVLVVSAAEGVQAQTRVLVRILQRLHIPFLVFVNKIDRPGARFDETLDELREALGGAVVAMTVPRGLGRRSSYVEEVGRDEMVSSNAGGSVHPTYFGAALHGVGVRELLSAVARFLPPTRAEVEATLHGQVFKVEGGGRRGPRSAYVRLRAGSLRSRDVVAYFHRTAAGEVVEHRGRATSVRVVDWGSRTVESAAVAGDIATVTGLGDLRIGDQLGRWDPPLAGSLFAQPGLETVVESERPEQRPALFDALQQLSEQDPLIAARLDGRDRELTVSLYGEVQKEVLGARLAEEFGIPVRFSPTRTVYVERVRAIGEAMEVIATHNATVGLRVGPGPIGSGFTYRLGVERGFLLPSYHTAIEETLAAELRSGLHGWRVIDAAVTLIAARFSAPTPPAGYFRQLTTLAFRAALAQAGTTICEPYSEFELEFPATVVSQLLRELAEAGAVPDDVAVTRDRGRITGTMPTAAVHRVEQRLPHLTQGRGVLLTNLAGYR